jgi:gliding motility-associated-like protein
LIKLKKNTQIMGKSIRSLASMSLIALFCHMAMCVNASSGSLKLESNIEFINKPEVHLTALFIKNVTKRNRFVALPAPTVSSPIYLCQNTAADPLSATSASGATLIWYGIAASGGTGSSAAPTPSTATVGQTKYYVSQSDSTGESPRAEIVVNVVVDNGSSILSFRCDDSQIDPADKNSSVFFDWTNTIGLPNQYTYYYVVDGGPEVTGTTGPTNLQVFNLLPGQSVTLTVWHTTYPCDRSELTCFVDCVTPKITPDFSSVPTSYCINEATTNLPTSSNDSPAITGTWFPAKVNTATAGTTNYVFTPDPVLFPCALTRTLAMTVGPTVPDFVDFSICSGELAPSLNSSSPNGVTGTWMPSSIDNMNSASYDFTPDLGQACSPTSTTIDITVIPSNSISSISWTVTEAFADNQIVTVTDPVGGDYLYRLDDGPFQVDPVFEMVSLGLHSITVRSVDGCSELPNDNVLVIDYPRFFTPNDDTYNDLWNIFSLADKSGSIIEIFDRYGKFLKEISPNGTGWDGFYNGQPLPATDYWFVVDYPEDGIIKKFRSHFSLKR